MQHFIENIGAFTWRITLKIHHENFLKYYNNIILEEVHYEHSNYHWDSTLTCGAKY